MVESNNCPQRLRCQRPKCCRYTLYSLSDDNAQVLVPLHQIKLTGRLEAGHVLLQAQLTYVNADRSKPLECTFEFPVDPHTVVSSIRASVGERSVEAIVK